MDRGLREVRRDERGRPDDQAFTMITNRPIVEIRSRPVRATITGRRTAARGPAPRRPRATRWHRNQVGQDRCLLRAERERLRHGDHVQEQDDQDQTSPSTTVSTMNRRIAFLRSWRPHPWCAARARRPRRAVRDGWRPARERGVPSRQECTTVGASAPHPRSARPVVAGQGGHDTVAQPCVRPLDAGPDGPAAAAGTAPGAAPAAPAPGTSRATPRDRAARGHRRGL